MIKNRRGFSVPELLVVIVMIGAIGWAGWYVWNKSRPERHVDSPKTTSTAKTQEQQDTSFLFVLTPSVGGGIMGETNSYEITASGDVNHYYAPSYDTKAQKTLLNTVTPAAVQQLRQSFIDSGALEVPSGSGPQPGQTSWHVTINNQEQTFYDQSSPKFDGVKSRLKEIFGPGVAL